MGLLRRKKKAAEPAASALPAFEIKPTAFSKAEGQGVLIAARQLPGYATALGLIGAAIASRADRILMDFTANAAVIRFRIDGVWENNPPLDRPTGDGALVVIKKLLNMNPNERKARQIGKCAIAGVGSDWLVECTSQGVAAGERVLLTLDPKKPVHKTLDDLGMRPALQEKFREAMNAKGGMVVLSAPAGDGLPTTWRVGLEAADKFVSDWVSLEPANDADPDIINVTANLFDAAAGQLPQEVLNKVMLKQPDVLVMPQFYNDQVMQTLLDAIKTDNKHVITRIIAKDPIEALLQLLSANRKVAKELLMAIEFVTSQRLVRRLCDTCKQPFAPSPQMLQKLGIPPGRVEKLYQPYILPPPEKRADEKGNAILPCPTCGGRGYFGRVAIFEMLTVNDDLRKAVLQFAKEPDKIRQYAKKLGHLSFQEEAVLSVALGITSVQELQRVMTAKT